MFIDSIKGLQPIESILGSTKSAESGSGIPFSSFLKDAMQTTRELQEISNKDAYDLAMGRTDNLSQIMINSAKATTAMELTVQVTSKVVSAYNQIMQMQV